MPLKILLIDNSQTIEKVFILALKGYSYELKAASEPKVGLELIQSFQPQLIFVDSLTKNLQISNFIQECHATTKAPIILLKSSFLEQTDTIKTLVKTKVIKSILEKPFEKQVLRKIVHPYIYNEDSEDTLVPVALDPIVQWENDLDHTEVPYSIPEQKPKKMENLNPQAKVLNESAKGLNPQATTLSESTKGLNPQTTTLPNTTEQLQKIILEQLNGFFTDQSKKVIKELATPIIQEYVEQTVKVLAKSIIEKEIQKMLNQSDTSPKLN